MSDKLAANGAFKGLIALYIFSLSFRLGMLNSISDYMHLFMSLHGAISEISVPFAILALAIYFRSNLLLKLSQWLIFLSAMLISIDAFNVYFLGARISKELLQNGILTGWALTQRMLLGIAMTSIWLVFRLFEQKTGAFPECRACKKNGQFVIISAVLLVAVNLTPDIIMNINGQSWEAYYKLQFAHQRLQINQSSFACLFSFSLRSLALPPDEIFHGSPYFEHYIKEFSKTSAKMQTQNKVRPLELWLHMQNSSQMAKEAFQRGFTGIEIDLHFDQIRDRFIVSHDWPENSEALKKVETLQGFLYEISPFLKEGRKIWLDIKNLNYSNINAAIDALKRITSLKDHQNIIWMECPIPFLIRRLSQEGFQTIQSFFYGNTNARLLAEMTPEIMSLTALSGARMISLPWQSYNAEVHALLNHFPVALYTARNSEELQLFKSAEFIDVLLTDVTAKVSLNE